MILLLGTLLVIMLATSSSNVTVETGVSIAVPRGYTVSNIDPIFNSTSNNEIYDPNFLPGFDVGLTNTSISWRSGNGFASLGYSIGPWTHQQSAGIPHLAAGPQCCNFQEIPHTQQFRRIEWGDYYYVKTGFGPPGVNVENYTTDFSAPAYVGLRTDWDWKVQFSLNWTQPIMMDPTNEWGAIGISVTQFVPSAPRPLVSTLINLWMDANSSRYVPLSVDTVERRVSPNVVEYHPVQITNQGNTTITLDISSYLQDTINLLGLQTIQIEPPVISYVYLSVEGYNFRWNTTLWSFKVMTQGGVLLSAGELPPWTIAVLPASLAILLGVSISSVLRKRSRPSHQ